MITAVTGANGHLARNTFDHLLKHANPQDLIAIVRNAKNAAWFHELGVTVRIADYDQPASLEAAFAGVNRLLFISGTDLANLQTQHANVVAAARRAEIGHLFATSIANADHSPAILAPVHRETEAAIRATGLPFTIFRLNWFTENYVAAAQRAQQTGTLVTSVGTKHPARAITESAWSNQVASASRADYAAGIATALLADDQAGRIYEFSGDVAWTYRELGQAIAEVIGRRVMVQPIDPDALVSILTGFGVPDIEARLQARLDVDVMEGAAGMVSPDLSTLIGRPTTPLVDGLRAALATPALVAQG